MKGVYLFASLVASSAVMAEVADVADQEYGAPSYQQPQPGYQQPQPEYRPQPDNYGPPPSYGGNNGGGYGPSNGGGYNPQPPSYGGGGYNPPPSYGGGGYNPPPSYGDGGYKPQPPSYGGGGYDPQPPSYGGYNPPPSYGGKKEPAYGNIHGGSYGNTNNGYDQYGRPSYGNPTYAPPVYESYTNNYKKIVDKPFPYTYFVDDKKKENILKIPKLADYHCFLTGAPWTTCGRKTLTTYFLDQCLYFYFTLSANVDGICGGEPPKPTPEPEAYNDNYYGSGYRRPTPEPTTKKPTTTKKTEDNYGWTPPPAPTTTPFVPTTDYLKEKCLQSAYVSITTATVMCLTENYIRINFIEHYAANACDNPVEGPILYLRKLHAFVEEVISCTQNQASANFPNLYKTFTVGGKVAYNPNAPYYLDSDKNVFLQQYTSGEASGLAAFTVGDQYVCANPNDLVPFLDHVHGDGKHFIYLNIPSTIHYTVSVDDAGKIITDATQNQYTKCPAASLKALGVTGTYRYCQTGRYTSDKTYRGLYDAVHYIERESSSLRRPQSIAEIAVRSAGVLEQPILEGFGIMYYCAFHACRANNDGDLSKCYPDFKSDTDWHIPAAVSNIPKLAKTVNQCIDDGYLDSDDITESVEVSAYAELLARRSYLCIAETEIVDFLAKVYPTWATGADDALNLVYGRHLADEVCYASFERSYEVGGPAIKGCPTYLEVYTALQTALSTLSTTCTANKSPKSKRPHYGGGYGNGYGQRPQYGDPQYPSGKYGQPDYSQNGYYGNSKNGNYGNNDNWGGSYDQYQAPRA
ncbi:Aste57867_24816 [Aphanomyces stellatus]|uniref:Aste57867_24816 protein n=1 Tax=Aphanomyces stellatus TaxID=120398 RepID=A0A485LSW0_9STRA|nr:hypothetical protein As57867_024738 [Aphanomyces stellatus]VFU01451.1 Aste57867_24816 [Aphanomyces stellatus]